MSNVRLSTESNGRGSIRAIVTGPHGRAVSSWWRVDDGSAEQEAGEMYDRLAAAQRKDGGVPRG